MKFLSLKLQFSYTLLGILVNLRSLTTDSLSSLNSLNSLNSLCYLALFIPKSLTPLHPSLDSLFFLNFSKILRYPGRLLITRKIRQTRNFQHVKNQWFTNCVISARYFVGKNIRKKNKNRPRKGLNRWKIGHFWAKKVAYIYCNPKKMLTFAGLLAQWNRDLGRQTPVIINKLKV
jgi:hypothetical protein